MASPCGDLDASSSGANVGSSAGPILADFEDREVVKGAQPSPLQLDDFEGRDLDNTDSDTASDEEIAAEYDEKKFIAWKHELKLAAQEEAVDGAEGCSTRLFYQTAKSDLVPMSTGKIPRDLNADEQRRYPAQSAGI